LAPRLQILEIFCVIGAKPHHHGKVADHGGDLPEVVLHFIFSFLKFFFGLGFSAMSLL